MHIFIRKYDIDIFTVGSDWVGKFDYLKEYCDVVYLDRTEGISSSEIREEKRQIKLGLVGDASFLNKVYSEAGFVNGIHIEGLLTSNIERMNERLRLNRVNSYEELLQNVDAVYIRSLPELHYQQIKEALKNEKNVLCESPITLCQDNTEELFELAKKKNLIVMEAIKTAYATAFDRLLLLIKGGKISIIGLHFLSFKIITFLIMHIRNYPHVYLATFPVIYDYVWVISYMILGIGLPLLIGCISVRCKLKIREVLK